MFRANPESASFAPAGDGGQGVPVDGGAVEAPLYSALDLDADGKL